MNFYEIEEKKKKHTINKYCIKTFYLSEKFPSNHQKCSKYRIEHVWVSLNKFSCNKEVKFSWTAN